MAAAFWTLEDGRAFARRWAWMANMLVLITDELKTIKGAEEFHAYLEQFVYQEENGDEYNGYGGFFRSGESIMFNFDLRTFTPGNREYFWRATQSALTRLKRNTDNKDEGIILLLTTLMDMHKRIKKGEDPMRLNHMINLAPEPLIQLGPGWDKL